SRRDNGEFRKREHAVQENEDDSDYDLDQGVTRNRPRVARTPFLSWTSQ
ncbi:MAG: hypothetical protein K0R61_5397, partial [Microvirga sp.]|nr:hypothetical protein [Microvirga sp.]